MLARSGRVVRGIAAIVARVRSPRGKQQTVSLLEAAPEISPPDCERASPHERQAPSAGPARLLRLLFLSVRGDCRQARPAFRQSRHERQRVARTASQPLPSTAPLNRLWGSCASHERARRGPSDSQTPLIARSDAPPPAQRTAPSLPCRRATIRARYALNYPLLCQTREGKCLSSTRHVLRIWVFWAPAFTLSRDDRQTISLASLDLLEEAVSLWSSRAPANAASRAE